jgi:hypothetical protein
VWVRVGEEGRMQYFPTTNHTLQSQNIICKNWNPLSGNEKNQKQSLQQPEFQLSISLVKNAV